MLSDVELSDMRSQQEENMPETVYIQAATETSNGAGGRSQVWATVATTKGRIGDLGKDPQERAIAERLTGVKAYVVTLPVGTAVDEKNQLQINGRQFQVVGAPHKSHQTALRVVCSEVK